MPERAFYSVIARRYICHACAEKAAAMPEGEKPQQTFMSTDEYSLATLPGSKSEYFPAILTANCGIDKWIGGVVGLHTRPHSLWRNGVSPV